MTSSSQKRNSRFSCSESENESPAITLHMGAYLVPSWEQLSDHQTDERGGRNLREKGEERKKGTKMNLLY